MKALGGAGNVVRNISAFDAEVACVGVVGDDVAGREVETCSLDGARRHLRTRANAGPADDD